MSIIAKKTAFFNPNDGAWWRKMGPFGLAFVLGKVQEAPTYTGPCALDLLDAELKGRTVIGDAERTAVVLWCAHTHVYACFKHTPRLFVTSLTPGCGKSELLSIVTAASYAAKKYQSGTTMAAIRDFKKSGGGACVLDQLAHFIRRSFACDSKGGDEAVGLA